MSMINEEITVSWWEIALRMLKDATILVLSIVIIGSIGAGIIWLLWRTWSVLFPTVSVLNVFIGFVITGYFSAALYLIILGIKDKIKETKQDLLYEKMDKAGL